MMGQRWRGFTFRYLNDTIIAEILQSHEVLRLTEAVQVPTTESECSKVVVDGPEQLLSLC
jgi:hypothetical protein